jgi:hypothetical protein
MGKIGTSLNAHCQISAFIDGGIGEMGSSSQGREQELAPPWAKIIE